MLGPGFTVISKDLHISISTLTHSTAWIILAIGLSVFIANPIAKVYGKRPVYIAAICILFAVNVWGAVTKTYSSFLASRIVGGIGMAPYEVLVQATISDLYFVHQRATRIALWSLFLLSGIEGASFIGGYIIEDLGYRWTFGICAIFFGTSVITIFFLVPETAYVRPPIKPQRRVRKNSEEGIAVVEKAQQESQVEQGPSSVSIPKKMSYVRSLRVFSGRYTEAPIWKVFARPFIIFWYPAVLWAFLLYGTIITWLVAFTVVNGVIFVAPPYHFSVGEAGLTGLSPFVLTIIGEIISGPLNDWICLKLTKRNHGVYEPEFRMVLMIVAIILGTVGFFGFGVTVHNKTHWTGPVLTYGLASMSFAFLSTCVFGYLLDSYQHLIEEAFVAINTRNIFTFGLTYFVNDWLARDGALKVFNVLGGCFLAVCMLTIPLWVFGKRIRSFIARQQWLNNFMTDL